MKKYILPLYFLIASVSSQQQGMAQHTFSIVAVDPVTGEVGGAGATCYSTVNDIADVHPGVGYIHTQSYVDYTNQAYARQLMNAGQSPQQIMDSLQAHDVSNTPAIRQYAAVDLMNGGRSAAFSGTSCFDYKGQRQGTTYAIAGNILLGPQILDSMEACFNRTVGSLADKLMAALQGAKVPGADKRCTNDGVSSLSSYMIVAKPTDSIGNYYLNLNVENVLPQDPIDVLQLQYNNWLTAVGIKTNTAPQKNAILLFPNPAGGERKINLSSSSIMKEVIIRSSTGQENLHLFIESKKAEINVSVLNPGLYVCECISAEGVHSFEKLIVN